MVMQRTRPRHFTMIREFRVADIFTLMNGVAGMGAILGFMRYCVDGERGGFWMGTLLLPAALLMDVLDGRVARSRQEASPLGLELDSLADIVSFGVAPAAMAFAAGLRGGWDALCLIFFVACGISRLARYNVTAPTQLADSGKVTYFEGMPIPSSLLLVALVAAVFARTPEHALPLGELWVGPFRFHPFALLFVAHGCAMVSKTLRIPKP